MEIIIFIILAFGLGYCILYYLDNGLPSYRVSKLERQVTDLQERVTELEHENCKN